MRTLGIGGMFGKPARRRAEREALATASAALIKARKPAGVDPSPPPLNGDLQKDPTASAPAPFGSIPTTRPIGTAGTKGTAMTTKDFPTLAVLSVTSGRLVTRPADGGGRNAIGELYEVLGWMTGDRPFTHQLERFRKKCRPWILRWHPAIAEADEEIIRRCEEGGKGAVAGVQGDMLERFGETITLRKIPREMTV